MKEDEIKKKKILLVEDNQVVRLYFSDIFWIHGLGDKYELKTCDSVEQAQKIIDDVEIRPDIIFSGLVMPMIKDDKVEVTAEAGLSLIKKIKSNPELKKIKVIIFSGYDQKKNRDSVRMAGADAFLVKHENMPTELVAFIEKLDTI